MDIEEIAKEIVDASFKIHKDLGPGLMENVYESILEKSLTKKGFFVERQKPVIFEYDGITFNDGFRVDLLVERSIVLELKSIEILAPVHAKQLLTYLKLLHLPIGFLINFGAGTMKEGLRRVVNEYTPTPNNPLLINKTK